MAEDDSVINNFNSLAFGELLVWNEAGSRFIKKRHYCYNTFTTDTNNCMDNANTYFGIDIDPFQEAFPIIYFYNSVLDTADVRSYDASGTIDDYHTNTINSCAQFINMCVGGLVTCTDDELRNAASNWVCAVVSSKGYSTPTIIDFNDCNTEAWQSYPLCYPSGN